ncbi:hypothetical protein D3C72_890300 [compost metagenome]
MIGQIINTDIHIKCLLAYRPFQPGTQIDQLIPLWWCLIIAVGLITRLPCDYNMLQLCIYRSRFGHMRYNITDTMGNPVRRYKRQVLIIADIPCSYDTPFQTVYPLCTEVILCGQVQSGEECIGTFIIKYRESAPQALKISQRGIEVNIIIEVMNVCIQLCRKVFAGILEGNGIHPLYTLL